MQVLSWLVAIFCHICMSQEEAKIMQNDQGQFVIQYEDLSYTIEPKFGGRIISVQLHGKELLLQEKDGLLNWGSTFWSAPQSDWNWPPPDALYADDFQGRIDDNLVLLESTVDPKFGFKVTKRFRFDTNRKALEIEYKIINQTDSALEVGPWEITCVPSKGAKVFFINGEVPQGTNNNFDVQEVGDVAWIDYDQLTLESFVKHYNSTPEGWLGCIDQNRNLLVKQFDVINASQIAPGQANLEVYINPKMEYVELENHGVYNSLKAGEVLSYRVLWYVQKLPASLSLEDPEKELLNLVRSRIK